MEFKGAIFDMDGTLIDSLICWEPIFRTIFQKFNDSKIIEFSADEIKTMCTSTFDKTAKYLHETYSLGNSPQEILETIDSAVYNFYANEVKVKDGVIEFLEHCQKSGVKMCLASATDVSLMRVAAKHCNIEKYFSHIISCSEIGKGKNFPDIYLKGLRLLGTNLSDTYVFEDSAISVNTAKNAGFFVVGIFDKLNIGQQEIKEKADVYIGEGETLLKLINS